MSGECRGAVRVRKESLVTGQALSLTECSSALSPEAGGRVGPAQHSPAHPSSSATFGLCPCFLPCIAPPPSCFLDLRVKFLPPAFLLLIFSLSPRTMLVPYSAERICFLPSPYQVTPLLEKKGEKMGGLGNKRMETSHTFFSFLL